MQILLIIREIVYITVMVSVPTILMIMAYLNQKAIKKRATDLERLAEKVITSADSESPVVIQINGKFIADVVKERINETVESNTRSKG